MASRKPECLGQKLVGAEPRLRVVGDGDDDQLVHAIVGGQPQQPGSHLLGRTGHRALACVGLKTATASGSSKPVRKKKSESCRNS